MATRADRLEERLRGAGNVNIGDDDTFRLDIPGLDVPPITTELGPTPVPAPELPAVSAPSAPTPGSNKRRKIDARAPSRSISRSPQGRSSSSSRRSARNRPETASSLQDVPEEPAAQPPPPSSSPIPSSERRRSGRIASQTPTPGPATNNAATGANLEDELDALRLQSSVRSPARLRPSRRSLDEVEESPANAPGSGRRRTRDGVAASASSARLQDVLGSDDSTQLSSPLARKTRTPAPPSAKAPRNTRGGSTLRTTRQVEEVEASPEQQEEPRPEEEVAEEISATDAAKVIGRARRRKTPQVTSPELNSGSPEADEPEEEEVTAELPVKRKRGRPSKSPVAQKQPTTKKTNGVKRTSPVTAKRIAKKKAAVKQARKSPKQHRQRSRTAEKEPGPEDDDGDVAIEITVQRYTNHKVRGGEDDTADPLHSEIPFANRSGESTVDVFAQVCEEVIGNTLGQFLELLGGATDAAKKKEIRVKMKAIDAYKQELSARLLQHTIHLDDWHSLRKRVRHAQKEKLALRDEILRLKAEREQVALRMDAIRTQHEAETKEATFRLDASALMHDIDLAVERGQNAPELTAKQQKEAELLNLELLIAQVADEASSKSSTGGLLKQVSEFNGFLERAALALESK